MGVAVLAICVGASAGALLRWWLTLSFAAVPSAMPMGTLAANLLGGYLVGLAAASFAMLPSLAPAWRLMIITGFLGGLTTFSAFSAEVVTLMQQNRFAWAAVAVTSHVAGSLLMTFAGMASAVWLRRLF